MNDLPGWHNKRPDPQDAESSDYCRIHHVEFWPSEGCYKCRAARHRATELNQALREINQQQENRDD